MFKKKTVKQFEKEINKIHNNKYKYYQDYSGMDSKIKVHCDIHGDFIQRASDHKAGKGCKICGQEKKVNKIIISFKEVLERFKKIHGHRYKYGNDYIDTQHEMTVICEKHGSFKQKVVSHIAGHGCNRCGIESTKLKTITPWKKVLKEFRKIHGNTFKYGNDYVNGRIKMTMYCKIHGKFKQSPECHKNSCGCPKCGIKISHDTKRWNTKKFIEEARKIHGDKYNYDKVNYTGAWDKVLINCVIHGGFLQAPAKHLCKRGCKKCGWDKLASERKCDIKEVLKQMRKIHNDYYIYPKEIDYKNNHQVITIICPEHGPFQQKIGSHKKGYKCSSCTTSVSGKEINWLNSLNLPNDSIHRQVLLRMKNGKRYNVDGFDPETNTIYEFQGDYWHGNLEKRDGNEINLHRGKTFKELNKETKIKEKDLIKNGYKLITIWESDWDKDDRNPNKKKLRKRKKS